MSTIIIILSLFTKLRCGRSPAADCIRFILPAVAHSSALRIISSYSQICLYLQVIIASVYVTYASCSISGLTFMDSLIQKPLEKKDNPCNPLYWYPRDIPEYCNKPKPAPHDDFKPPAPLPPPVPVPIPIPMPPQPVPVPILPPPPPIPIPIPFPVPFPGPIPAPMPLFPPMPMPAPFLHMPPPIPAFPTPPLPYGVPLIPTNPMVPVGGFPYPYMPPPPMFQPGPPAGMVPGVPGIVSPDGGINILPFSDAYTDLIERHKRNMISKKLAILLKEYESKSYRKRRKTRRSGRGRGEMFF